MAKLKALTLVPKAAAVTVNTMCRDFAVYSMIAPLLIHDINPSTPLGKQRATYETKLVRRKLIENAKESTRSAWQRVKEEWENY